MERSDRRRVGFRGLVAVLLGASLLLLTGCSDFVDRDQLHIQPDAYVVLEPGRTVGQTFVAQHGGLNGVEFWLEPKPGTTGRLLLHLRSEPHSATDLAVSTLPLEGVTAPGFYRFSLPQDNRSHGVYRYAFLELEGAGAVRVGAASGEAYLDGAAYRDHEPLDAQLAFRLTYDVGGILVDLILMIAGWIGYGFFGLTVLFLAGYWIVRGWAHRSGVDFLVILITSIASALALWMLFLVWSALFKIRLSEWIVRSLLGVAVFVGMAFFIKDRQRWGRHYWLGEDPPATLAMWLVIAGSVGLRLWIGRGLVMLPGCDAYHHTLIVQLFADQGGLPDNYEPYAPLQSFSYHFGFHSIVALFRWLLESELLSTTKVMALILNGGIAATAGLFSEQIAGHRRAGVVAAALVGLIMVSPFCLLRWSRFTQTTGLFFLPVALLALTWGKREAGVLLPSLLSAAVFFSHSRVALMLGIFAIVTGGMAILQGWKDSLRQIVTVGVMSVILASPWLLRVLWVQYDPYGLRITYPLLSGYNDIRRMEEPVLYFITNWPVLFSILLLTIAACVSPKRIKSAELIMWCGLLVGGALLSARIGFSLWDVKTTLLSLAIPFAGFAGLGVQALEGMLSSSERTFIRWVLIVSLTIGIIGASLAFPRLIYTGDVYLRPGDLLVMSWIKNNLPADVLFAVNALQFDWSPGWVIGSDAGYWIPLLGNRSSVILPMVYFMEWTNPWAIDKLKQIYRAVDSQGYVTTEWQCSVLKESNITHILTFSGSRIYVPASLMELTCFGVRYRQDRTWIFELIP